MKRWPLFVLFVTWSAVLQAGTDPYQKIARHLASNLTKMDKPRVALLAFPYHDEKESSGSSIVSERLTTQMAGIRGIRVVERTLIRKILEEQHLTETGVIDPASAQKIGQILEVDVIVTGTLIDFDDGRTEINARALQASTGEIISASRTVIKRSWTDRPKALRAPVIVEDEPEPETRPSNEAIEIGYPARPGGAVRGGGFRR